MTQPTKNETEQLQLLRDLYETAYNGTECFEEENIGADLAYLMGAVLNDSC
jgi:hypothetical protein